MAPPHDQERFQAAAGDPSAATNEPGRWRKPWVGHVVASLFVGTSLYLGNVCLSCFPWAPPLVGYAVPVVVFRFSTWWNRRPFSLRAALIVSAVMGTAFYGIYRCPIPYAWRVCVGYVAPCAVSMVARSPVVGGFLAARSD